MQARAVDRIWALRMAQAQRARDLLKWAGWEGVKDLHRAGEISDEMYAAAQRLRNGCR